MCVAVLTLLLTYRSRLSPYQQKLFERQIDAATDVLQALGRYHDEAVGVYDTMEPSQARNLDARTRLADVRSEFFRSYRRWNVVIPQPVTEAVTAYLRVLEEIKATTPEQHVSVEPRQSSPGYRLANAYAAVLGAAQRELRVKTLSDKTLGLIESMSRQSAESTPSLDPLYIKATTERPLFESFTDESTITGSLTAPEADRLNLLATRDRLYVENRNLFLVHAWRPSAHKGQLADISIRLVEHERRGDWPRAGQASQDRPLTDGLVERAEYYLGPSFRRAFDRIQRYPDGDLPQRRPAARCHDVGAAGIYGRRPHSRRGGWGDHDPGS